MKKANIEIGREKDEHYERIRGKKQPSKAVLRRLRKRLDEVEDEDGYLAAIRSQKCWRNTARQFSLMALVSTDVHHSIKITRVTFDGNFIETQQNFELFMFKSETRMQVHLSGSQWQVLFYTNIPANQPPNYC